MRNTKAWLCCDKNDPEERQRLVKPKREKKGGKPKCGRYQVVESRGMDTSFISAEKETEESGGGLSGKV